MAIDVRRMMHVAVEVCASDDNNSVCCCIIQRSAT